MEKKTLYAVVLDTVITHFASGNFSARKVFDGLPIEYRLHINTSEYLNCFPLLEKNGHIKQAETLNGGVSFSSWSVLYNLVNKPDKQTKTDLQVEVDKAYAALGDLRRLVYASKQIDLSKVSAEDLLQEISKRTR